MKIKRHFKEVIGTAKLGDFNSEHSLIRTLNESQFYGILNQASVTIYTNTLKHLDHNKYT